jgi:adenylate cyclase
MYKVTFRGKVAVEVELGKENSLLVAANKAGIALTQRCRGHARCGTCLVTVEEGQDQLSPVGTVEARILRILKARQNQRLACQTYSQGEVCCRVD